jgi:hypothetical protein
MTQTSVRARTGVRVDRPLALVIGIPLECRWERRGREYITEDGRLPQIEVDDSTPLRLDGRFMTNGNGAEVTGGGRQQGR